MGNRQIEGQDRMEMVTLHLPPNLINWIDSLVVQGVFPSRSETIRTGLYLLLSQFGAFLNTNTATNANILRDYQKIRTLDMAKDLLKEETPKKVAKKLKKKGLTIPVEVVKDVDKDKDMKELYQNGVSIAEIARRTQIPYQTVYKMLKKSQKDQDDVKPESDAKTIDELYQSGMSIPDIAKKLNISYQNCYYHLKVKKAKQPELKDSNKKQIPEKKTEFQEEKEMESLNPYPKLRTYPEQIIDNIKQKIERGAII